MSTTRRARAANGYGSALPLFDAKPESTVAVPAADPSVLDSDRPRLSVACVRILERLKHGPATNLQLENFGGQRFGARLHDLRKAGVIWKREHVEGAVWRYELIQCPEELT